MRTSVKYRVIYRHKDKYSISEMCRFFKVSRSGYYGFVSRMAIPDRDLPLADLIRECQEESHQTYGYRRVHIWLENKDVYRNPKTILRVMQKYNLLSVVRRKKYRNYSHALHKYPNLLNRDFHADKPNQKWVTDTERSWIQSIAKHRCRNHARKRLVCHRRRCEEVILHEPRKKRKYLEAEFHSITPERSLGKRCYAFPLQQNLNTVCVNLGIHIY